MKRRSLLLAASVTFMLVLGSAHAESGWSKLRVGMSGAEALKHLGQPLFRNKARGLERWIYDGGGEVVFFGGPMRSWTVAAPAPDSQAKPLDTDVLMRPYRPTRWISEQGQYSSSLPAETVSERGSGSDTGFRYR